MAQQQLAVPALQTPDVDFVHQVAKRIAIADPLHEVLEQVVVFVSFVVRCDSCFIYALERDKLVLRASMNPHPEAVDHLKLRFGQGITGWVAEHVEPVVIPMGAFDDPRFRFFNELPEDRYEAFLSVPVLCRGKVVGVINVQHREPHSHTESEVRLISTFGFLVGAEIELARLETENSLLSERLESRKIIERAKGILQRELHFTEEQAYLALQKQSRQRRKTMKELAEAIVLSEDMKRQPR
jgi:signal transduction protein with GAF and PtsI domain